MAAVKVTWYGTRRPSFGTSFLPSCCSREHFRMPGDRSGILNGHRYFSFFTGESFQARCGVGRQIAAAR